jgi:hypothetical protein
MADAEGNGGAATGGSDTGAAVDTPPLDIFISYRRIPGDQDAARQINDTLRARFGPEHVFFDVSEVQGGDDFMRKIKPAIDASDVLIAVIGPRWADIMDERNRQAMAVRRADYVRIELERAFERWPDIRIIPVLVGGAHPLAPPKLPRPIRGLAALDAIELRHDKWNRDLDLLVETVEASPRDPQTAQREEGTSPPGMAPLFKRGSPDINPKYAAVARKIANRSVVPVLGPGANVGDRSDPWHPGCEHLPDAEELARHLAEEFDYPTPDNARLPAVSEFVHLSEGPEPLYQALRDALDSKPPSSVHHFLAGLPAAQRRLHGEPRYQLILTTNYDDALERAFTKANEPYDLAIYTPGGRHAGQFVHVPYDSDYAFPVPEEDVKTYGGFPIEPSTDELQRTVIVKVHGTLNQPPIKGSRERLPLAPADCVLTEDNYIDYLTSRPVDDVIPATIFNKLMQSHVLFLGYSVCDWNLRVLLHRIWGGNSLPAKSWAVQCDPEPLDEELWRPYSVDLHPSPLVDYVTAISEELKAAVPIPVGR